MDIHSETLKKPQAWAVIIPSLLLLIALYLTLNLFESRRLAERSVARAQNTLKMAGEIIKLRRLARNRGLAEQQIRPFDTVNSALEAASAAGISDQKIYRGSSPSAKRLKDGSRQYRESFKINHVMMYQIAAFVDYAERNFESLRCTDITVVPSPDLKNKDSWDANINFIYVRK